MTMNTSQENSNGVVAFEKWRRSVGVSRTTGWRWRRSGWLQTFNISGKIYLERAEASRFVALAKSGQFAKPPTMPTRKTQPANMEMLPSTAAAGHAP
jgi:hypothetical protein